MQNLDFRIIISSMIKYW